MSKCNFCENEELVKYAERNSLEITHLKGMMGGKDVYVHPEGMVIKELSTKEKKRYWRCWFMRLGKRCEC